MLAAEGAAIFNDKLVEDLKNKLRKAEKIQGQLWEKANSAQVNAIRIEKESAQIEEENIPLISLTSESSISGVSESSLPYDPAISVHGSEFSMYEPVDRVATGPSSPVSAPSPPRPTTPAEDGATRQQRHDVLSEESWTKDIQRRLLLLTHPTKRLMMTQFLQDSLI